MFLLEVMQMNNLMSVITGFVMITMSIWAFRYMDRSLKLHTEFDAVISNIVQKVRVLQVGLYSDNQEVVDVLTKQGVADSIFKVLSKSSSMGFSIHAVTALFNMKLTKRDNYKWVVLDGHMGLQRPGKNPIVFGKLNELKDKGLV